MWQLPATISCFVAIRIQDLLIVAVGAVTNALRWTLHVNLAWHTHSHHCNRPSVLSSQKVPNGMEARSRLLYIVSTFNPHLQSLPWIVCLEHARITKKCLKKKEVRLEKDFTQRKETAVYAFSWRVRGYCRADKGWSSLPVATICSSYFQWQQYVALPFSGNNM